MSTTTRHWSILILLLSCMLGLLTTQCINVAQVQDAQHTEADVLVLSVANSAFGVNAFASVNINEQLVVADTKIGGFAASGIYIDPLMRIWISYLNPLGRSTDNVEIYDTKDKKAASLQVCNQPRAGIQFTDQYAFVACAEDGFVGRVTVISLTTLAVKKQLEIKSHTGVLLLIASAINDKQLLLAGLTTGPRERSAYTLLTVVNAETLAVEAQIGPIADLDVWSILPYQDKFILLNVASWSQPEASRVDAFLLTPGVEPQLKPLLFAPSPLWGVLDGDNLFAYHNPTWNQLNSDSNRMISRFNLTTGKFTTWTLPDDWYAEDIDMIAGNLVLTSWDPSDITKDGVYRFDLDNHELHQMIQIPSATQIVRIPKRVK